MITTIILVSFKYRSRYFVSHNPRFLRNCSVLAVIAEFLYLLWFEHRFKQYLISFEKYIFGCLHCVEALRTTVFMFILTITVIYLF